MTKGARRGAFLFDRESLIFRGKDIIPRFWGLRARNIFCINFLCDFGLGAKIVAKNTWLMRLLLHKIVG